MGKIKISMKKDLLFYRMISVFSILASCVVLIITAILFSLINTGMKAQIYKAQETSLRQMSAIVGFRAEYVNSLLVQVKADDQISKLFYSKEPIQDNTIVKRLNEIREPVRHLNSVYVYNEYTDTVFYSGENRLPFANNREYFADKGFIELLEHIKDYPKYTPILRKVTLEWPSGQEYDIFVYTYLIYDSYDSGPIRNIVAFNFHLGWIEDALNLISVEEKTSDRMWIVDANRQIVYTNDGQLIGTVSDSEELPDEVMGADSGYLITGSGAERKMLTYATPSRMGYENWTFVSWTDYAKLMRPLEQIRKTIFSVCGLILLISLAAIFWVSTLLYEPFRKTIAKVTALEGENERKRQLERMIFLQRLFLGNIPDDANIIRDMFEKHQIQARLEGSILVTLLSVDDVERYYDLYRTNLDQTSETILRIILDVYHRLGVHPLCVRMHGSLWAMCVPSEQTAQQVSALFESMNQQLREKLDISATFAVSSTGHTVRDIPFLYSEALNVLSYRFLRGKNSLLTAEDTQQHEQSKYEYPNDVEKKLLSNLFGGKYPKTMEQYQQFLSVVLRFTVEDIRLSFVLLAHAVKAASQKTVAEASGTLAEFDRFYKRLGNTETIDEVNVMFTELFAEITDKLKQNSKERHDALVDQIEAYVQEHYGDLNLSMNDISDHVNMSAAYLGRLFKQVTGITFIEYLTKFRLKEACNLLTSTNMTVNDISDRVGFTNCSYFYIIFKKNMECTPNQYRRQNSGGADEEA